MSQGGLGHVSSCVIYILYIYIYCTHIYAYLKHICWCKNLYSVVLPTCVLSAWRELRERGTGLFQPSREAQAGRRVQNPAVPAVCGTRDIRWAIWGPIGLPLQWSFTWTEEKSSLCGCPCYLASLIKKKTTKKQTEKTPQHVALMLLLQSAWFW